MIVYCAYCAFIRLHVYVRVSVYIGAYMRAWAGVQVCELCCVV